MIVLDEKKYAIQCLENGHVGSKPFFELSIIAKYYYHSLGYKKNKINTLLNEFMQKNYPNYLSDKMNWQETIDRIVKNVNKYKLIELDGISVSKSEMQTISKLNSPTMERIMFTILCLAKRGIARNPQSNGWVNVDTKEIFNMARVPCGAKERELCIGSLCDIGFLELPKRNDNVSIRVTFIDNESEELFISDFRELGYEYLKYKGENFIRCADCGILVRGNKNKTKRYCSKHGEYIRQETKIITCVDCGKDIEVAGNNKRQTRCPDCYAKYRHARKLETQRIRRKNSQ